LPAIVAVPVAVLFFAIKPVRTVIVAPSFTVNVPVPLSPTLTTPEEDQLEPVPVTVAVPFEPLLLPM